MRIKDKGGVMLKAQRKRVHIIPSNLLNPTNPISVNIIGAGGTGSCFLTAIARMNFALNELGHSGMVVKLFDCDTVTEANLGRQLFTENELGMNKAVALINRVNRFFGTNWKAVPERYGNVSHLSSEYLANITISCVDTIESRKGICNLLYKQEHDYQSHRDKPIYLLDFGNGKETGQVWLSTVGKIKQPDSEKFNTVEDLADIFKTYPKIFERLTDDNEPSCSLAQALNRQDLFINSVLANMGASLLWSFFRTGILEHRGFFLNLKDFKSQPVAV